MIQLHHCPSTAAMVPHLVLEELGVPYQLVPVDRAANAHKAAAYLRLNPNGLIPVLVDGDLVLYETAAIVLHLCDQHPGSGLAPAVGTRDRAHFHKWLVWLTNTLQATLIVYFYPHRWVDEGNAEGVAQVRRHAHAKVVGLLGQLEEQLGSHAGPWFFGEQYTALDPYVFTLCRWTRNFDSGRARDLPRVGAYLRRMLDRPAVQRVLAQDQLQPPYV
ncbi:MAG TPA: glutathione S-transferase family protein [Ramlibacter sp.]